MKNVIGILVGIPLIYRLIWVVCCAMPSHSVVSDSSQPHLGSRPSLQMKNSVSERFNDLTKVLWPVSGI